MTFKEALGIEESETDWKYSVSLLFSLISGWLLYLSAVVTRQMIDKKFVSERYLSIFYGMVNPVILILSVVILFSAKRHLPFHIIALLSAILSQLPLLITIYTHNFSFGFMLREVIYYFIMLESFNFFLLRFNNRIKGLVIGFLVASIVMKVIIFIINEVCKMEVSFSRTLFVPIISALIFWLCLVVTGKLFKLDSEEIIQRGTLD